jgi:hypothetical protein
MKIETEDSYVGTPATASVQTKVPDQSADVPEVKQRFVDVMGAGPPETGGFKNGIQYKGAT